VSRPLAAPEPAAVDAALERLRRLHPKVIDLSLDRVYRLLEALGNPHHRLPPVVHLAGTNGKGSTLALLRGVLEAAGLAVHAYTSPHLVRFNERIVLGGRTIGDDRLAEVLDRCETINDGQPITYFEVTTCAAFLAFAETPADILLLETGLGGRLDATNVIARPAATAITRISIDHTQFLGPTLRSIAFEKAGILKPGVPCAVARQADPDVTEMLRARAEAVGAPLIEHGRDWRIDRRADGFALAGPAVPEGLAGQTFAPPVLPGDHQIENAATAILLAHLARTAETPLSPAAIARGLASADWPGRLQRLDGHPLAAALPEGWELWLDGGHNDSAGEALAAWAAAGPWPVYLVAGLIESKEPQRFLAPLAKTVGACVTVPVPGESAGWAADALAGLAGLAGFAEALPAAGPEDALRRLAARPGPARVLIAGSLYLAGSILAMRKAAGT
jgi:dihydrofolate synthase/folylpolyglutamate synthase